MANRSYVQQRKLVEDLSRRFHAVYQEEARRQAQNGDDQVAELEQDHPRLLLRTWSIHQCWTCGHRRLIAPTRAHVCDQIHRRAFRKGEPTPVCFCGCASLAEPKSHKEG